ncbi:hypothetical protein C3K47_18750 [Solitalea longa]|uniref:Uncharacterized protein n=1 Tax=Solitalea longa TaxID=2079460 RepID=A0A2S4ZWM3_9SPHI|nr:hypothetical protein [Solitalea longa]POY34774.1 hypothetical protein C3K47_18750 [Solitalea longa]
MENPILKKIRTQVQPHHTSFEFIQTLKSVCTAWKNSPNYIVFRTSSYEFEKEIARYEHVHNNENELVKIGSRIKTLENEIHGALSHVKRYVRELYGADNIQSRFNEFGIIKSENRYILPRNREGRILSLISLIEALEKHQLQNKKHGIHFWETLLAEYDVLLRRFAVLSYRFSVEKKTSRSRLLQTLTNLIYLIRAQHPENYYSILKIWGLK